MDQEDQVVDQLIPPRRVAVWQVVVGLVALVAVVAGLSASMSSKPASPLPVRVRNTEGGELPMDMNSGVSKVVDQQWKVFNDGSRPLQVVAVRGTRTTSITAGSLPAEIPAHGSVTLSVSYQYPCAKNPPLAQLRVRDRGHTRSTDAIIIGASCEKKSSSW